MPDSTLAATAPAAAPPDPRSYGVGARFSLHPMTTDFVPVILAALAAGDASALDVVTDDVSTFVQGAEADVLAYLRDVIAAAAATRAHTVAHVLLSRGCPGEVTCELGEGAPLAPAEVPALARTGLQAAAQWSLYPLDDGDPVTGRGDHMAAIYAAIERAKTLGTFTRAEHFATRLDGDLADVLTTIGEAWVAVGRSVRHVTSHATISLNSPTATAGAR